MQGTINALLPKIDRILILYKLNQVYTSDQGTPKEVGVRKHKNMLETNFGLRNSRGIILILLNDKIEPSYLYKRAMYVYVCIIAKYEMNAA